MTDRPILFSAPMVRALLAGSKTQTRRVMTPQPELLDTGRYHVFNRGGGSFGLEEDEVGAAAVDYLRISVGDRLYVREAHKLIDKHVDYRADFPEGRQHFFTWRPGIHMPRWASRITLTVTDVRVQRLQEISDDDAFAEGIPTDSPVAGTEIDIDGFWWAGAARARYRKVWETINGPGSWGANPWVACYSFRVIHKNIDAMAGDE